MGMFVTNFVEQGNTLYRNLGDQGLFSDVSWPSKLAQPSFPLVGWGTSFFDMDNDTWPDIFVANGHVYPQVDSIPGGARYKQSMLLFRNKRDGTFADVSTVLSAIPAASRRGAAFGDINNDGNVDIVIVNVGEPPSLLLNQGGNNNHSRAVQVGRREMQQVSHRSASDRDDSELDAVQRSARRRQLSLTE
jgi:hypothetical protein